jgi:MFS family permease
MAVVLFSLLLFSGTGSRWGSKILPLSINILILLVVLVVWMLLAPVLIDSTMGLPLPIRIIISVVSTAPIGFLMGIPFPAGLDWVRRHHQSTGNAHQNRMAAWIWAVNGSTSVIATILSSLLALSFGFKWTFVAGLICYLVAWVMVSASGQRSRRPLQ